MSENEIEKVKAITITENGSGYLPLFTKDSKKEELVESLDMSGYFVNEMGIEYEVGDRFKIRKPSRKYNHTYTIIELEVVNITEDAYQCKYL